MQWDNSIKGLIIFLISFNTYSACLDTVINTPEDIEHVYYDDNLDIRVVELDDNSFILNVFNETKVEFHIETVDSEYDLIINVNKCISGHLNL